MLDCGFALHLKETLSIMFGVDTDGDLTQFLAVNLIERG